VSIVASHDRHVGCAKSPAGRQKSEMASGRFCARGRPLLAYIPAMSRYRRPKVEGGIFFFIVVPADPGGELAGIAGRFGG
jgi:hypothetical protein